MTQRTATSTFTTASWDERDIEGPPHAPRHTALSYGITYIGDISGTSTINLVMVYTPEGSVPFVGYEFFEGAVGDASGTVVFEHRGVYNANGATSEMHVVPNTATGDLDQPTILGHMHAGEAGEGTVVLNIQS